MADFSHLNSEGQGQMVDVGAKVASQRVAKSKGSVTISQACADQLDATSSKEIITTARIAGVQAAKQTANLIPYCHSLSLSKVDVQIYLDKPNRCFEIEASASTEASTGVEMETQVALSIAAVTIYDMIKAINPEACLGPFF